MNHIPVGLTDNTLELVQVMAWCRRYQPWSMMPHSIIRPQWVNSLAPGKFEWNFRHVIFKHILVIDGWGISCEIAQIWTSLDFTHDQSTLVQVMAWCHQATSHYLSQWWPRSLLPYDVTRPQWVNTPHLRHGMFGTNSQYHDGWCLSPCITKSLVDVLDSAWVIDLSSLIFSAPTRPFIPQSAKPYQIPFWCIIHERDSEFSLQDIQTSTHHFDIWQQCWWDASQITVNSNHKSWGFAALNKTDVGTPINPRPP